MINRQISVDHWAPSSGFGSWSPKGYRFSFYEWQSHMIRERYVDDEVDAQHFGRPTEGHEMITQTQPLKWPPESFYQTLIAEDHLRYMYYENIDLTQVYRYSASILSISEYHFSLFVALNHINSSKMEKIGKEWCRVLRVSNCSDTCPFLLLFLKRRSQKALAFLQKMKKPNDALHRLYSPVFERSGRIQQHFRLTSRRTSSVIPNTSILLKRH